MPDFVEEVQAGRRTRLLDRERQARLAGAASPTAQTGGGNGKTDIYLDGIGELAVRLRGARPRPGHQSAPAAAPSARVPGARQRLLAVRVPRDDIRARPQVTVAHEYNHILQFGYDAYQDSWFAESTAIWMEDEVYNGINDYLRYVRALGRRFRHPADRRRRSRSTARRSGTTGLPRRYGRWIMRSAWVGAIHAGRRLLRRRLRLGDRAAGNSDFGQDFARFARDLAEWRTDTSSPKAILPDVPRQGSLPLSGTSVCEPPAQPHDLPDAARPPDQPARPWWSDATRSGRHAGRRRLGRADRQRAPRRRVVERYLSAKGAIDVGAPEPARSLQPLHRGPDQRRHQAPRLQRPALGLELLDRKRRRSGLGAAAAADRRTRRA